MANSFINYLQSRSPQAKRRILASVVLLAAVGMGAIWVNSIRSSLGSLGKEDLIPEGAGDVLSASVEYISIESAESKDGKRLIYFKVENATEDILNFPAAGKVTLKAGDKELIPESLLNRQQKPFALKILSNTTTYGILVFPEFEETEAELTVTGMSFEQNTASTFKQEIEIDFEELKPLEELRS